MINCNKQDNQFKICGFTEGIEELNHILTQGINVLSITPEQDTFIIDYLARRKFPGRPEKYDKEVIRQMRASGKSYREISKDLGCSSSYVYKICNPD